MTLSRYILPAILFIACSTDEPATDSQVPSDGVTSTDGLVIVDGNTPDAAIPTPCAPSDALLGQIDPARMLVDLQYLVGLVERRSHAGQQKALSYLKAELSKLPRFQLSEHTYDYQGQSYVNLIADLKGNEQQDTFVVASAHYDSISPVLDDAPGADDNASGVAAVLELARIMSGCDPGRSLRLVIFSNEEKFLEGSQAYFKDAKSGFPPDKVAGVLNVDQVGFAKAGEQLDLISKPARASLVDQVAAYMEHWTSFKVQKKLDDNFGCGDDITWLNEGYDALCVIAEYTGEPSNPTANPYFHTVNDTLDTLNLSFHAEATRALVAAVGEMLR